MLQKHMAQLLRSVQYQPVRCLTCSAAVLGRRTTIPYDKRNFPTTDRDINEHTPRGNKAWNKAYAENYRRTAYKYGLGPQPQGYYKKDGTLVKIPEMIPEFVVPDLTDCKLLPYVPYNVGEVTQTEFTAKDLFDATYGKHVSELYSNKQISADDVPDAVQKFGKDDKS